MFFLAIGALITSFASSIVSAMQGRERMGFPALMNLLGNLLDLGLVILVISTHSGVVLFTALCIPVNLVIAALNVWLLLQTFRGWLS